MSIIYILNNKKYKNKTLNIDTKIHIILREYGMSKVKPFFSGSFREFITKAKIKGISIEKIKNII